MSSSSRLRSARLSPVGWVLTFVSFGRCRLLVLRADGKADRDMGRVRNVDAAASTRHADGLPIARSLSSTYCRALKSAISGHALHKPFGVAPGDNKLLTGCSHTD